MDLKDFGFVEVGEWRLDESVKSGITFQLSRFQKERVLYAFAIDHEPKYIGVCDKGTTTLKDRMGRFRSRAGGATNQRIAEQIRDSLRRGAAVKILALEPDVSVRYQGLTVDLVKGLENPLLEEVGPEWNIHK